MNHSTRLTLNVDPNGATVISNDRTRITIQPDGTVAVSSYDPIQLTGASLAKLDKANLSSDELARVNGALLGRLEKKTAN